jgi:hypothetical protein
MINLKKNDKLIIIIAVVIIIISGIGIAAYNPPEEVIDEKIVVRGNTYTVDWNEKTNSIYYSEFVEKNTPYEGTVSINRGNLKEIIFNLSWVDNRATILNRFGLDTLTIEITTPDGTIYEESDRSASGSKEGNIEIAIPVNGMPSTDSITANNSMDAEEKLNQEPHYNDKWVNEIFDIKISVQIGEIRILKKMRDSGNDFELEVSYDYYSPTLTEEEVKDTGSGDDSVDNLNEEEYTPPYLSMIIGTGCGRYI